MLSRIAKQIAHISRDRITLVHDKINGGEQDRIKGGIEAELTRLQKHLRAEYLPKWKVPAAHHSRQYYGTAPVLMETTTTTPAVVIGTPIVAVRDS